MTELKQETPLESKTTFDEKPAQSTIKHKRACGILFSSVCASQFLSLLMGHLGCVFFPVGELGYLRRTAGIQRFPKRHAGAVTSFLKGEITPYLLHLVVTCTAEI